VDRVLGNIGQVSDVLAAAVEHHGDMDVTITFDECDPPAGALHSPEGEEVPFHGRMGLLQAIDRVLTGEASAIPVLAAGDQAG
jgi:hypothetical protein